MTCVIGRFRFLAGKVVEPNGDRTAVHVQSNSSVSQWLFFFP